MGYFLLRRSYMNLFPGHFGVSGNEGTDRLGLIAPVSGTNMMDKKDIVTTIHERMVATDTTAREPAGVRIWVR